MAHATRTPSSSVNPRASSPNAVPRVTSATGTEQSKTFDCRIDKNDNGGGGDNGGNNGKGKVRKQGKKHGKRGRKRGRKR